MSNAIEKVLRKGVCVCAYGYLYCANVSRFLNGNNAKISQLDRISYRRQAEEKYDILLCMDFIEAGSQAGKQADGQTDVHTQADKQMESHTGW